MEFINNDFIPQIVGMNVDEIYDVFNNCRVVNKYDTLVDLLTEAFQKFPNHVAINEKEPVYYQELQDFSDEVSNYIKQQLVDEEYILVYARRDWKTVAIILGILKAGKAYVPISPDIPDDRLKKIQESVNSYQILDSSMKFESAVRSTEDHHMTNQDPAYVIFTSGSTGVPKGVEIPNFSVTETIQVVNRLFGLNEFDVVLAISALTFDLSIFDLFSTLSVGAKLVLLENNTNPALMLERIKQEGVTTINTVPNAFRLVLDYAIHTEQCAHLESLRTIVLSGDVVPMELVESILNYLPQTNLHIMGGPTEITIWSNNYLYQEGASKFDYVPYGTPIANKKMFIMKDNVPVLGESGEIVSGGAGLATQYIGNDELTDEKFWEHPEYGRLYNTGDMGIIDENGLIRIQGRIDNQVKINGFRIELEEVEKCINDISGVAQSIVAVHMNANISKLVAAIKFSSQLKREQITDQLKAKLPEYSIPSSFYLLETIPLSENQKLDRKKFNKMLDNLGDLKEI